MESPPPTPALPATHLRPLPLALGLILGVSAIPVGLRPFSAAHVFWGFAPDDILWNVLLYFPLGAALRRQSSLPRLVAAGVLSASIECLQFFYVGRYPSVMDLAMNVVGLQIGATVASRTGFPERLRLDRRIGVAVLATALLVAGTMAVGGKGTDFSNWDPRLSLALGDDPLGTDPWAGSVRELAILADALPERLIRRTAEAGPGSVREVLERAGESILVAVDVGAGPAQRAGAPLLGAAEQSAFHAALVERGRLSLVVRWTPAQLRPHGPTCIVCYSGDARRRNFVLGQLGRRIVFQLRTPSTGTDALVAPRTHTRNLLIENREVTVAAVYDGSVATIHVDGRLAARSNYAAAVKLVPFLADSGLPAGATFVGALAAAGGLALGRPSPRRLPRALGPLYGVAGGVLLVAVGAADALPGSAGWVVALGGAAGLAVSLAVAPRTAGHPGERKRTIPKLGLPRGA